MLPAELIFKPLEAFQAGQINNLHPFWLVEAISKEKNLSPRLVKLRFDFFEAKRRDLLAAARRARDALMADERREKESSNQQLAIVAKESGLTQGAVLVLNSDTLKLERQKLLRAQDCAAGSEVISVRG